MTQDQIMKLVDDYADATYASGKNSDVGSAIDADCVRVAVVAAIEQLTKDAERYQWLRNGCGEHHIGVYDYAADDKRRFWLAEKNLDREIDAAIAAQKEQV